MKLQKNNTSLAEKKLTINSKNVKFMSRNIINKIGVIFDFSNFR